MVGFSLGGGEAFFLILENGNKIETHIFRSFRRGRFKIVSGKKMASF